MSARSARYTATGHGCIELSSSSESMGNSVAVQRRRPVCPVRTLSCCCSFACSAAAR